MPSIDDDQLLAAYDQLPGILAMSAVAIAVFGTALWPFFPSTVAGPWVASMLAVVALRGLLWLAFQRIGPSTNTLSRWRFFYNTGSLLAGASWGLGAAALAVSADGVALAILVGIVMCVSAVSTLTMGAQQSAMRLFVMAALLPSVIAIWFAGGPEEQRLSMVLVAGLVCVILVGRRSNQATRALLVAQSKLAAMDAQVALGRSEERYRALVEWSPEPICVTCRDKIVYVNPAAIRLFGAASAHDLVGREMLDFVQENYRRLAAARRQSLVGGAAEAPMAELQFVKLDGSVIDCESQELAIAFDGEPAVQMAMRDVTAQKKAEAALAASRIRTERLLQGASVGLWEWDLITNDVYYSPAWKQHLGYEDHELPNTFEQWQTRMHPDDLGFVLAEIAAFREGNRQNYEVEFRMRHRDGGWHWFFSQAELERDAHGRPIRIMGSQIDVSATRNTDAVIRENELRLRLALRGANLGLWDWNAADGTLVVNTRWRTMLGMPIDGAAPSIDDWHARVHPDDMPKLQILMGEVINSPSAVDFEVEVRARHDDGEYRWIFDKGAVVNRDRDGRPLRIVGTHMDITDRKQSEAARLSLESQLRESHKMQAIGTLAGGVAHDFNNIIGAILGNSELARQDAGANHAMLEYLEQIRRAGTRGRDLVQQILSFSRRQPTAKVAIALDGIVRETVQLLRATMPARLILSAECAAELPAVMADKTQIQQVMINLANNAMQAMPAGPGKIDIRIDSVLPDAALLAAYPVNTSLQQLYESQPGRVVRLVVADNGPGMDAATLQRIFEPFFTTKPVNEGTGLGLSVVHGIVEAHDGAIVVESQPGRGTTFSIFLPTHEALEQAIPAVDAQAQAAIPAEADLAGELHILYLDDDEAMVFLVGRLLERRGYRVSAFTDQAEALAALAADPGMFNLVVTDYNMPGLSGIDVANNVRKLRADLPVAIASGFIDDALRTQAATAGVQELIFKANVADDFCAAIARLAQPRITGAPPT